MIIAIQNTIGALQRRASTAASIITQNLQMWLGFTSSSWVGGELVVLDESTNSNNAKLFTGKALEFNGNDAVSDFGNPNINLKSICFWVNLSTTTEQIFNLTSTHNITASSGVITLGGTWSNSNIYVDGITTTSIGTTPKRVVITTDTNILVNDLEFARIGTDYGALSLSDVQIYDAVLSLADALIDYNNPNDLVFNKGGSVVLANLVGYWALSEGSGSIAYDSSGQGNNGAITGATYVLKQPTIPQLGMMDWRKGSNFVAFSEPTANEGSASGITYQAYNWDFKDFTNSTYFAADNSVTRYRRFGGSGVANVQYTASVYIKMDDLSKPNTTSTAASANFKWFINGTSTYDSIYEDAGNNIWRVSSTRTTTGGIFAIEKAVGHIAIGFNVVGWQLEKSSSANPYFPTAGLAAINATLIQNPNNIGYDVLGNSLRLREGGFNLDGSGYAEVADSTSLNITTAITLSAWVRFKEGQYASIISKTSSNNGFQWYVGTQTIKQKFYIGSASSTGSTNFIPLDTWAYVSVVYNGTSIQYYLDGQPDGSQSLVASIPTNALDLFIGQNNFGSERFKGVVDDVLIYDEELTATEILNNYNVGLPTHS